MAEFQDIAIDKKKKKDEASKKPSARQKLEEGREQLKSQIEETGATRTAYLEQMQSLADPYTAMGEQGLSTLQAAQMGITSILQDPSSLFETAQFKAQEKQMQRAVETSQAAKGMQLSGATLKELQTRGQELGSSEIDRALQRQGMLASLGMQQMQAGQTGLGFLQNISGQQLQSDALTQQGLLSILGSEQDMYSMDRQIALAKAQAAAQRKSSTLGGILGLVGTVGGAYLGGPLGAAIGGQIGNTVAQQYGTTPGSQQTQMLEEQNQGF